jgi:hypothetical protein
LISIKLASDGSVPWLPVSLRMRDRFNRTLYTGRALAKAENAFQELTIVTVCNARDLVEKKNLLAFVFGHTC